MEVLLTYSALTAQSYGCLPLTALALLVSTTDSAMTHSTVSPVQMASDCMHVPLECPAAAGGGRSWQWAGRSQWHVRRGRMCWILSHSFHPWVCWILSDSYTAGIDPRRPIGCHGGKRKPPDAPPHRHIQCAPPWYTCLLLCGREKDWTVSETTAKFHSSSDF